jgi:enoyl-CoA hydratase
MAGIQANIDDHTRVATVTLCEPERRNAISHEMADQIREAFGALEADERVGAVVVTGAPGVLRGRRAR